MQPLPVCYTNTRMPPVSLSASSLEYPKSAARSFLDKVLPRSPNVDSSSLTGFLFTLSYSKRVSNTTLFVLSLPRTASISTLVPPLFFKHSVANLIFTVQPTLVSQQYLLQYFELKGVSLNFWQIVTAVMPNLLSEELMQIVR